MLIQTRLTPGNTTTGVTGMKAHGWRENARNTSNQQLSSACGGWAYSCPRGPASGPGEHSLRVAGLGASAKDNWLPSQTLPKDQLTMEDPKRAQGLLGTHLLTM